MDRDDFPIGRLLTRREALGLLGVAGIAGLAGCGRRGPDGARAEDRVRGCVARPEQTEGPYFVDQSLRRSDIRTDPATGAVKEGTPLALVLAVSRIGDGGCTPLSGAHVDLWHCDAMGIYSGVKDPGFDTTGQRFLRGYQITDGAGEARFQTIYPGWYRGRTVHIHFKVRTDPGADRGHQFTSQLYFDDGLTSRVHQGAPYAAKGGRRDRNADDGIFARGGDQLLLAPTVAGKGYAARFAIGLELA